MNILVVCQYYYPEEFQINDICETLIKRGHRITVLTGLPNYPTGTIPEEYKHGKRRQEIHNGVKINRCFEFGRRKSVVGLALNYFSFCISASYKSILLKKDFDVIYIYQLSPVLMAIPGIVLKKITNKKIFLYCCDIWPESMKIMHISETSLVFKIMKKISTYIYSKCDLIGIQSKAFLSYFQSTHGIMPENFVYIPQFADSSYLQQNFITKHEGINLVFMGNVGIAQNLECLVDAVDMIKNIAGFKVHIIGDGSYLQTLKNLVTQSGLDSFFVFYGRRPFEEMGKYYAMADACLLTLSNDNIIGQTIPSKLQGYMAAGKMVIAAIDGPANEVISESGCGVAVSAQDRQGLAEAIRNFICHPEKYAACGEMGKKYFISHFTKEQYIRKIEDTMQMLVGD